MYRVINRNKYIEKNLCITLVIYQELISLVPYFPDFISVCYYVHFSDVL